MDELAPPRFHDRHSGTVGWDVGELELGAVEKELIVTDGGQVVGHGGAMRDDEEIMRDGVKEGRRLKVDRQGVVFICAQSTASFGRSIVSRFWTDVCDSR